MESVEAYPLSWPAGVPRTPSHKRGRADFGTTTESGTPGGYSYRRKAPIEFGAALSRLRDELRRLGARNVVVSSNVPTRGDGMPYARSRAPEDPGVAVYFTIGGQPTCLPCDRWNRIADNTAAVAKHIAAMRGMERWGVGTTAQLFAGFKALPPKGGTSESTSPVWRDVLGVGPTADYDVAQAAYRALARKYHPDAGGDAGAMAVINRAWEEAQRDLGRAVPS